jgi:phosphoribosylamine--glycine ligase
MNILIIGSGGREHAIALKLFEENSNHNIYISPGNGGTKLVGENIILDLSSPSSVVKFCYDKKIELVVIGPEIPLVDGLADVLRLEGILVFGPGKDAARIEGDKKFAKNLMQKYSVPTASFKSFSKEEYDNALDFIKNGEFPIVLKASGLAAGKGVIIANTYKEAEHALSEMMKDSIFGSAGDNVVIEEFLEGEELSVFVVTDGEDYVVLPPAQDHKRIGDGDTGKNTGGMGAYSPVPFVDKELLEDIEDIVIKPTLKGLRENDSKFIGCLYCGLIKTKDGIKVIEFNCRFGDPEIQAVLQLLDGKFSDLLKSTAQGKVDHQAIKYNDKSAMCVVAASGGYPDSYDKGFEIRGIPQNSDEVKIIHAGTKETEGKIVTNGGRVLNVVSISSKNDIKICKTIAYDNISKVKYNKIYYRKDIGYKIK